jgi:membrane protein insertase Oxa1/YidC/SpoIIIJ
MRQSPGAIFSEVVNVIIQIVIILMLYRIFSTGLEGADLHLIYQWMPKIKEPINLMFLGQFDLSHTNNTLNIIQSLMIALSEFIHLHFSPVKPDRKDLISLVIIFPIVCFFVFLFLPAGKKVYIITSLIFSIVVTLIRQAIYLYYSLTQKPSVATAEVQNHPTEPVHPQTPETVTQPTPKP